MEKMKFQGSVSPDLRQGNFIVKHLLYKEAVVEEHEETVLLCI